MTSLVPRYTVACSCTIVNDVLSCSLIANSLLVEGGTAEAPLRKINVIGSQVTAARHDEFNELAGREMQGLRSCVCRAEVKALSG